MVAKREHNMIGGTLAVSDAFSAILHGPLASTTTDMM